MIREIGPIELSTSLGRSPITRKKQSIEKVNARLNWKKQVTTRKLVVELNISPTGNRRILE